MKKRSLLLVPILVVASVVAPRLADAHECTYDGETRGTGNQVECHETPIMPNWRDGNYVPLFDLSDRDDPDQRRNAQRWREECQGYDMQGNYHSDQMCAWARGGYSHTPNRGVGGFAPNELHVGFAANHCFLGEFAHQCEDHDKRYGEGIHDAHGGAVYADVCVTANPESKYCKRGTTDNQVGVTVMDHNPCGTIVPIVACTDEYHLIRPLDTAYTTEQMEDSATYIPRIVADPMLYLCGYREYRGGAGPCAGALAARPNVPGLPKNAPGVLAAGARARDGRPATLSGTPARGGAEMTLASSPVEEPAGPAQAASALGTMLLIAGAVALRVRRALA